MSTILTAQERRERWDAQEAAQAQRMLDRRAWLAERMRLASIKPHPWWLDEQEAR